MPSWNGSGSGHAPTPSRGQDVKNKRILITGGAGLIGSHIAELVAGEAPREIVVLDNFVRGRRENLTAAGEIFPITVIEGDICDTKVLSRAMEDIDIVFHQAATHVAQSADEPRLALEVMSTGTFNVLEAAVGAGVTRLVAASSGSAFGASDSFPMSEHRQAPNSLTFYGAAKAFNEAMLASFADRHGLNYVALRYFNVYGPRMDAHGIYSEVLIRWMERIEAGLPPIIHGDGSQAVDFVHVRDVARANVLAAKAEIIDEVFDIGSRVETSTVELARRLATVMGSPMQPVHTHRSGATSSRRPADTGKAAKLLGFESEVMLDEGLRDLVAWWRSEKQAVQQGITSPASPSSDIVADTGLPLRVLDVQAK
jgi:UDP-glucose 4-epimerase